MIVHEVQQGSNAWRQLRVGLPTASNANRIVTPTGKVSTSQELYFRELIAEIMLGFPAQTPHLPAMAHGNEYEAEAVSYYEFMRDVKTERIGFVTNDAKTYGASPDRIVSKDLLLEVKCPASPAVHVGHLLFSDIQKEHRPQLQMQMLVMECSAVDIISYYPGLPECIVTVPRDEEYIKILRLQLDSLTIRINEKKCELAERGMLPAPPVPHEWITEADVEMILAARREVV